MVSKSTHTRKIFTLLLGFIFLLGSISPISAQSGLTLSLEALELDQFPKITLFLNAYDGQGKFIRGMDLDNFKVYEDGIERTINEAQELEPGLHTIIAINLGATLSNRANAAVPTRYEETIFSIASWLNDIESDATNQYSLTSNEGVLVESAQEKNSFTNILQNYKPNLYNFEPNLTSLIAALDIASKPSLVSQSKQAILYITPLPLDQDLDDLLALQSKAQESGVPVNIWLVAPDTAINSPAVQYLNQLSAATGGKFLFYTEESATPDPEEYVGRLRNTYRLRYTSTVSQSGDHNVRVATQYGNLSAETADRSFSIMLSQPRATLVNFPEVINREYVENIGTSGRSLQPLVTTLQAIITFPDGYSRQLKASRLYVDGEVIIENTEAPFDYFGWNLESYQYSGEHLIAVEIEDILGFRFISNPQSITVNVASLYPGWLTGILRFINLGGWIPLMILALGSSVFVGWRLRRQIISRRAEEGVALYEDGTPDPIIQSVPGLDSSIDERIYSRQSSGDIERDPVDIAPRLVNIASKNPSGLDQEIILTENELIIGSDASQAQLVLEFPFISPMHASLKKSSRGSVSIADLGSESGTWVNYAPVSSAGVLLHNDDLVQIGKLFYRYRIGKLE